MRNDLATGIEAFMHSWQRLFPDADITCSCWHAKMYQAYMVTVIADFGDEENVTIQAKLPELSVRMCRSQRELDDVQGRFLCGITNSLFKETGRKPPVTP